MTEDVDLQLSKTAVDNGGELEITFTPDTKFVFALRGSTQFGEWEQKIHA